MIDFLPFELENEDPGFFQYFRYRPLTRSMALQTPAHLSLRGVEGFFLFDRLSFFPWALHYISCLGAELLA